MAVFSALFSVNEVIWFYPKTQKSLFSVNREIGPSGGSEKKQMLLKELDRIMAKNEIFYNKRKVPAKAYEIYKLLINS